MSAPTDATATSTPIQTATSVPTDATSVPTDTPAAGTRTTESLRQRWQGALMDNYGTPAVALVRGRGARVWDAEGREYLDLLAGIAVNSLGHAHPAIIDAITTQAATLGHTSNLAITEPAVRLAERLQSVVDPDSTRTVRTFFCNSGAEANEAALKLSRLTGRTRVVAADMGFHGRTMGALALTGQPAKQDPFRPLPGDITFVPYADPSALAAAVDDCTAAVILEPVQGEGGVIAPPRGYLAAARAACDRVGALLILDEVQTGVGRTGSWFAYQTEGVEPDIITLAKGLAGGMPIGAVVGFGRAAGLFTPGSHGSTFGGNPLSCAAALAVLDTIEREGLLGRVQQVSQRITSFVAGLDHPLIDHVRGRGLLLALALSDARAKAVESSAYAHGLIVNAVAPNAIRLAPPLVITDDDLDLLEERLPVVLDEATR